MRPKTDGLNFCPYLHNNCTMYILCLRYLHFVSFTNVPIYESTSISYLHIICAHWFSFSFFVPKLHFLDFITLRSFTLHTWVLVMYFECVNESINTAYNRPIPLMPMLHWLLANFKNLLKNAHSFLIGIKFLNIYAP